MNSQLLSSSFSCPQPDSVTFLSSVPVSHSCLYVRVACRGGSQFLPRSKERFMNCVASKAGFDCSLNCQQLSSSFGPGSIHTTILAFFLGEALFFDSAFLFFSGDFFFFSFSFCFGLPSVSDPSSLSEEDGLLSNLAREQTNPCLITQQHSDSVSHKTFFYSL